MDAHARVSYLKLTAKQTFFPVRPRHSWGDRAGKVELSQLPVALTLPPQPATSAMLLPPQAAPTSPDPASTEDPFSRPFCILCALSPRGGGILSVLSWAPVISGESGHPTRHHPHHWGNLAPGPRKRTPIGEHARI